MVSREAAGGGGAGHLQHQLHLRGLLPLPHRRHHHGRGGAVQREEVRAGSTFSMTNITLLGQVLQHGAGVLHPPPVQHGDPHLHLHPSALHRRGLWRAQPRPGAGQRGQHQDHHPRGRHHQLRGVPLDGGHHG